MLLQMKGVIMRKQLKLSKETEELLKYYKQVYYDVEGYKASYTFIANKIIEEFSPEFTKVDWLLVKNTKSNKAPKNDKDNTVYDTTLNLTNSAEANIGIVQRQVIEQFKISRVHMAFAVKMILRAYYLKNVQKINVYKK